MAKLGPKSSRGESRKELGVDHHNDHIHGACHMMVKLYRESGRPHCRMLVSSDGPGDSADSDDE